jgi:hypothetical protein
VLLFFCDADVIVQKTTIPTPSEEELAKKELAEILCLERDLGMNDLEGQRVLQVMFASVLLMLI